MTLFTMPSDLISVVIPTYNRIECIEKAIRSALAQTYRHLEVIIIDDGSTDGTASVVKQYLGTKKVKYIFQDNRGPAAARNRGMVEARGAWIAFLDSDDEWFPWKLEVQIKLIKNLGDVGLIFTDFSATVGAEHHQSFIKVYYPIFNRFIVDYSQIFEQSVNAVDILGSPSPIPPTTRLYVGDIARWIFRGNFVPTLTVLGRRDLFLAIGGMDETLRTGEDADFYLRFCLRHKVAFLDVPSAHYTTSCANRLSADRYTVEMIRNWYRSLQKVVEEVPDFARCNRELVGRQLSYRAYRLARRLIFDGNAGEGRKLLSESLGYHHWDLRAMVLLGVSVLPIAMARRWYRQFLKPFFDRRDNPS